MKLGWLVLAAAALGSSWQRPASACSVILPQKQSLACEAGAGGTGSLAHTSVAQARLVLDAVEVQRSQYAPPGRGDCGELGSTRLRFHLLAEGVEPGSAAEGSTWPADVGLLLTLREGQSGYFAPPPTMIAGTSGWLLLPQAGVVRLFGPDDPQAPLALLLEARAVDCSGALSAPVAVQISHPGRSDAAGKDAGGPEAVAPPVVVVPEGAAGASSGDDAVLASRTPAGSSCAVCSVRGAARDHDGAGLALALGALALSALRRRRRSRA